MKKCSYRAKKQKNNELSSIVNPLVLFTRTSDAETAMLIYSNRITKGVDVERLKGSKDNIIAWSPAKRNYCGSKKT